MGAWARALEAAAACTGARATDFGGAALRNAATAGLALGLVATVGERVFLFLSETLSGATAGRFATRSAVTDGPWSATGFAVASRAGVAVTPGAAATRAAASRAASAGSALVAACVAGVSSAANSVASPGAAALTGAGVDVIPASNTFAAPELMGGAAFEIASCVRAYPSRVHGYGAKSHLAASTCALKQTPWF